MADEEQENPDEGRIGHGGSAQTELSFLDVRILAVTFLAKHSEGTELASASDRELAVKITASEDDPDHNEKRRRALIAAERILGKKGDYEYEGNRTSLDPLTT